MEVSSTPLNFDTKVIVATMLSNEVHFSASKPVALNTRQRDWAKMTRTIAHYERIEQIGEGTYGQVYKARCMDTNEIVALKKIRVHHGGYWGMPPTVIREIKILKRLRHPNLVQMLEVVSSKGVEHLDEEDEVSEKHKSSKKDRVVDAREGFKGNLFLVLEYVSHDLTGLMDVAYRFSEVQVKCIFRQLLEALQYMHDHKYVHRDIKSSNILIDHNFRVKLADFGLARCLEPAILDKIHEYVKLRDTFSQCSWIRLGKLTLSVLGIIARMLQTTAEAIRRSLPTKSSHCGTALQSYCLVKRSMALLSIFGAQDAYWPN